MKTPKEIQHAHDVLHFLVAGEDAPALLNRDGAIAAHAAHDALSWVLGFPCGETLASNLEASLAELKAMGFEAVQK